MGQISCQMNRLAPCTYNQSTKDDVANSNRFGMGFRQMQLLMMDTCLIFIYGIPKKLIEKGLRPMHIHLLHMFENFCDVYYHMNMDNLFNSVQFTVAAAMCKTMVLTQGVLWKNGRGVPPCIVQEEVIGKKAEAARGTVIAAVLEGDARAQGIIVASCFDKKPSTLLAI